MKKLNAKLFENLTSKQRFVLAWEATARGDEAELGRLQDTVPVRTYSGQDLVFRRSWDSIVSISLAVEADLRGNALNWLMAIRAQETALAEKTLKSMIIIDTWWRELLKETGLSDAAIKAANPERHPMVETLLSLHKKEDLDPEDLELHSDVFKQFRKNIPILKEKE